MNWNPPLSPTLTLLLALAALVVIVGGFVWSRRQIDLATPAGMAVAVLRGLAFLLALFLLLQPSRLPEPTKVQARRTLAVLLDTSGSMSRPAAATGGEPDRLTLVRRWLRDAGLIELVTADANLALYTFDSQARPIKPDSLDQLQAAGRGTDLALALDGTLRQHENDDLAAVLLFTDGRHNQGADPRAIPDRVKVPLLIVPVGDAPLPVETKPEETTRDLRLESVSADPRIILGRTAQAVVSVSADGYPARQVAVELLENGQVISTSAVTVSPQQPRRQAIFTVKPPTLGTHKYVVRVPTEQDDANPANNAADFSIDVVDPVNRLLYIDRVRDERRFLKPILQNRRGIKFTAVMQQAQNRVLVEGNDEQMKKDAANLSPEQLRGLKAIILGDLPGDTFDARQIAALASWVDQGGALLVLAGPSSLGDKGFAATPLGKVLPVTPGEAPEYLEREYKVELTPEGAAHPAFQRVQRRWSDAAPLLSRYTIESVKPAATVLIATADEERAPVVVSQTYGHGKVGLVLTDSTWRWQLAFDPGKAGAKEGSEHGLFWRQMIDWLMPDLGESAPEEAAVQLVSDRMEYEVGDTATLMASVRGADGSVVADAVVEITVATPDGRPILRTATLDAASGAFTAAFDPALEGTYEATAVARRGNLSLGTDRVQLRVTQPVIEFIETDPDRPLLADIAQKTGGRIVEPADLRNIVMLADLAPREVLVQPSAEKDAAPAWDRWYFFLAFVLLVGGEWLIRRKNQWV